MQAKKTPFNPDSEEYRLDWIRRNSLYELLRKQEEEILKYDDRYSSCWLIGRCGKFLQYRIDCLRHEEIMRQVMTCWQNARF